MDEEEKSENINEIKKGIEKTKNFFKNKNIQIILIILILIGIITLGTFIRVQNLNLLKDVTTGKYIPLALDPFYFLRVAETIVDNGGHLPAIDAMRYPSLNIGYSTELTPISVVLIYKIFHVFNSNATLGFADVISPVIFFILGLIVFFILVYILTKSKWISLLGSLFLAFIPTYLYRTMAGFADHEAIGMFAFFLFLLCFSFSLKYLDKEKLNLKKTILFGLISGVLTAFTVASWGGIGNFCFMILPLGFFISWLIKFRNRGDKSNMLNFFIFYISWVIFSIFSGAIFGIGSSAVINRFTISYGLLSLFVLGFILVDYVLARRIIKIKFIKENYRQIYSIILTGVFGVIFLILIGKNPISLVSSIWNYLLHPFGTGRVGLTVAENAQPYLKEWISQTGKVFFWMFLAGLVFIGFEILKILKRKKEKNTFVLAWVFMIAGILFSRVSSDSLFNGINFISQLFYILGLLIFILYSAKLYFRHEIKLKSEMIFIASWMFFMLISARSAVRFFFAITPFVCFSSSFFVVKSFEYLKKSKEELMRIVLIIIVILAIIGSIIAIRNFYTNSKYQAENTGPSANYQWQKAMSWVRENTPVNSIFVHWWDYGYWIQTLGQRATITDGGHQNGFWDHLTGRYILTATNPGSALSFMKSQNVSYLLIDPTDFGKYGAYSKIGSDENWDRFSGLMVSALDSSQTRETSTGTTRVYQLGIGVDEDIKYNLNGQDIFLPGPTYDEIGIPSYKSALIGIVIEEKDESTFSQPIAVYGYNGQQISIPLKYFYYQNEMHTFENGLDAVVSIIPRFYTDSSGTLQYEQTGGLIYLSPKVSKTLFAQLYLLNDAFENYPELELVHREEDPLVSSIKSQGLTNLNEFIYYQGFRGPIKIWKYKDSDRIISHEEFLRTSGEYAEFDDLQFVK